MIALSEAQIERAVDRGVTRRLATDRAYRNAESAEAQAEREAQIEREEYQRITGQDPRGVTST
jgi:hypothetical protein